MIMNQIQGTWVYPLWKFSRPHTIIGTSLSVWALYLIALAFSSYGFPPMAVVTALSTWLACICGNIYIVGLNQLVDVEIDKINKPHLPLAAGEFTNHQGKLIVVITGILAVIIASLTGPFLLGMVAISLVIGTAYSLPPIRLKRFPFWAALCIFSVRGTIVNLGLFLHFNWALQQTPIIPPEVWVLTVFILVFTFAIAIFKDIPDMEGDRLYNINTFTVKIGPQKVFYLTLWVITACYLGIVTVGILPLGGINSGFLIITHLLALSWMWVQSLAVDLADKTAITDFYQFIWKLFYLEYIIFPIACILT